MEFIKLTDWKTSESIYVDPRSIAFIQQIQENARYSRRTRVDVLSGVQCILVKEDADQVALLTARGSKGIA